VGTSAESQECVKMLFGGATPIERRPSTDETVLASNTDDARGRNSSEFAPEKRNAQESKDDPASPVEERKTDNGEQAESSGEKAGIQHNKNNSIEQKEKEHRPRSSSSAGRRYGSSRKLSSRSREKRSSVRSTATEGGEDDLKKAVDAAKSVSTSQTNADSNSPEKIVTTEGGVTKGEKESGKKPKPENFKQLQHVAVVFRDENGNIVEPKTNTKQGTEESQKECKQVGDVDKQGVDFQGAGSFEKECRSARNAGNDDTGKNEGQGARNGTSKTLGTGSELLGSQADKYSSGEGSDLKFTATSATLVSEDSNVNGTAEIQELSAKEKRRAARKSRREKKVADEAETSSAAAQLDINALLGMIGSTEDDFKTEKIATVIFDAQPLNSVDFFQGGAAPPGEENVGAVKSKNYGVSARAHKGEEKQRGVTRSKSSDDATEFFARKSKGLDLKEASEEGDKKRGVTRSKSSDDASDFLSLKSRSDHIPKKAVSLRSLSQSEHKQDKNRKIRRQHIAEEEEEENHLPPPSLAGDTYIKKKPKKSKSIKRNSVGSVDAFALMGEQDMTETDANEITSRAGKNGRSRKIRMEKDPSAHDDSICEQSLAPPSLAGDVIQSSNSRKGKKDLQTVSESISEEVEEDNASSSRGAHMEGVDDDEGKRKKRAAMMKKMKKATSALAVVNKSSKGISKKAKSARNVFDQAATKVFSRRKDEGKGLLKDED